MNKLSNITIKKLRDANLKVNNKLIATIILATLLIGVASASYYNFKCEKINELEAQFSDYATLKSIEGKNFNQAEITLLKAVFQYQQNKILECAK